MPRTHTVTRRFFEGVLAGIHLQFNTTDAYVVGQTYGGRNGSSKFVVTQVL